LHEHGLEELHEISLGARVQLVVQHLISVFLIRGLLEIWRLCTCTFKQALLKIIVADLIFLELSYPGTHLTFASDFLRLKT
jgi:hypothetical protein